MDVTRNSPTHSPLIFCFLLLLVVCLCRASVINLGDSFTIRCAKQTDPKNGFSYDPTLDFKNPNGDSWGTLFTGGSPRPETKIVEWASDQEGKDPVTFVYTLKAVAMTNGGKYRCNNVKDTFHDLTVIDPNSMECPSLQEQHNVGEIIDPKCSLQKSGPASLDIKWFVDEAEVTSSDADATTDRASSKIQLELTADHNKKSVVCQYDGTEGKPPAKCSLSLDVLFPVSVVSSKSRTVPVAANDGNDDAAADSGDVKFVTEVLLTGNPAPDGDNIDVQASGVEKIETKNDKDGLIVLITYATPETEEILNFTYNGEILKQIPLQKIVKSVEKNEVDGAEDSSAAVAIGCVCGLLVLIIICAVVALYLKKNHMFPFEEKAENEEETKKLDSAERGKTLNEPQEKNLEEQKEERDEKEKLTKIEDVDLEKKEDEEKLETKDVGKQDDQPPNADEEKE